ncbi:MAG: Gfo/Idh/MocA family oxidoreductase [Thaumarchaeota archaeon]|nr:Gfo/Idh/MocA family oxidoreductase [Nitrososphaerota archaeon]
METKHAVALVGLGKISDAHLQGWREAKEVQVKIVVDTDGARAGAKAREYGVPEFGTDFQAVLERQDIDIVDLAIPHFLHAPYSIAALKAGKHVLVEKPVATKLSDAEEMIKTAESTGKKLMVAEPIRFSPSHRRAARMIEQGEVGDPFLFNTRAQFYVPPQRFQGTNTGWRSEAGKIGGGVLLESGIHNIATATFLMGDVESVVAFKGKQTRSEITVEDTISVLFRFESGATGHGSFSWAARWSDYTDDFTVFGTEGVLGNRPRTGRIFLDKGKGEVREWVETQVAAGKSEEIKHFLDCIDNDKTPVTSAAEETKNLKVVLAAYLSATENRPVKIEELKAN